MPQEQTISAPACDGRPTRVCGSRRPTCTSKIAATGVWPRFDVSNAERTNPPARQSAVPESHGPARRQRDFGFAAADGPRRLVEQ